MRPNQLFVDMLHSHSISIDFTTGAAGGMLMMPVNLGFTASPPVDSLSGKLAYYNLVTPTDSTSLLNDRNGYYDHGIYQDGTNYGIFDLQQLKPSFDFSADFLEQPFNGGSYPGGGVIQNEPISESVVIASPYNTLKVPIAHHTNLTDVMTTGWCVIKWNIKPNTTISLMTRNPSSNIQRGHKVYFYDGVTTNSYNYNASASNIALIMKDYSGTFLYAT